MSKKVESYNSIEDNDFNCGMCTNLTHQGPKEGGGDEFKRACSNCLMPAIAKYLMEINKSLDNGIRTYDSRAE